MSNWGLWSTIIAAGILTFSLRLSFIALIGVIDLPPRVRKALAFVPPAVLSAIVCPAVALKGGSIDLSIHNIPLLAALVAAVIAWRTRNILLTLVVGMLAQWLLRWWLAVW